MRGSGRLVTAIMLVMAFGAVGPGSVLAAAPSNDTYKNATPITALPYTQAIDLSEATDDPGYPPCEAGVHGRIWYTFSPPANEGIRVSVGGDEKGELALWKVTSGGPKGIQLVGCGVFGQDLVGQLTGGAKYAISVGQTVAAPPLIATLTIAVQPPPANDAFADAIEITSAPFSATIDEGSAVAATLQAGEPTASCMTGYPFTSTIWYGFSPAQSTRVAYSIQYVAALAVYRGTSLGGLTEVACENQSNDASFLADGGSTYYFQVMPSTNRETVFSVNFASPPTNDTFANASAVGALPATLSADLTAAGIETGEPTPSCTPDALQTAWWSFTPAVDGTLSGTLVNGSSFWAAYKGSSPGNLAELGCGGAFQSTSIPLVGGQPTAIQIGFSAAQDGSASLDLQFVATPTNDDFADATPIALGDSVSVDLVGATVEPDEANPPSCAYSPGGSVWYDFVGTGDSVSFGLAPGSTYFAIAAYGGSDLASLTQLGCRLFDAPPLTIKPAAGVHVRIQLWSYVYCCGTSTTLTVQTPGAPVPAFQPSIGDPSSLDDVAFYDQTRVRAAIRSPLGTGTSAMARRHRIITRCTGLRPTARTLSRSLWSRPTVGRDPLRKP